jgi:NADPH-dependent 2,4-dienoyl-CoA reductase/sulfur reductase-like enzyme
MWGEPCNPIRSIHDGTQPQARTPAPSQSNMEQARVVIVGAGPAGLVAGLSLEQQGIAVSLFLSVSCNDCNH